MKRNKSIIIGVTGGVGAGKSTILSVLEKKYNAKIYLADDIAKELMLPGQLSHRRLVEEFGTGILDEQGYLDQKKMSVLVFSDPKNNAKVNSIVHPIVAEEMKRRVYEEAGKAEAEDRDQILVMEAALLIEGGLHLICDRLWYAYASVEDRTNRLMESRGYSRLKCEQIMEKQKSETEFALYCTDIINTSGSFLQTEAIIDEHVAVIDSIYRRKND